MLRYLAAAALLAAAASAQTLDCREPVDQHTMNKCAWRDFDVADKNLNTVYRRVMQATGDESTRTKLRLAQRAWIQFRDSQCTFENVDNEGGSIYPMVFTGCKTRLTKARTKELADYLACLKNADNCGG